jgi:hypothetical protein
MLLSNVRAEDPTVNSTAKFLSEGRILQQVSVAAE